MHPHNLKRGALYMLASSLLFAGMGAIVKTVSQTLPNEMVVFFRSAIGLLALLPWLAHRGFPRLATRHLPWHLARGLAGLGAMYCFFFAIAHMPLAEAVLLNYSTPLFIPFIALALLGEHNPRVVWGSVGLGFLGVLFILKPGLGLFTPVALVGLGAGFLAALAMVSIRRLTRTESTTRIVFYFSLISTLGSAVPLAWAWRAPPPGLWVLLILMGVLATVAQLLLTRAYAQAPTAQVGPFIYSTVVFATLLGWGLWGELPDRLSFVGIALVAAAGILATRYGGSRMAAAVEAPPRAEPAGNG